MMIPLKAALRRQLYMVPVVLSMCVGASALGAHPAAAVDEGSVETLQLVPARGPAQQSNTAVLSLPGIRHVSAGGSHVLAATADGTGWAWGDNAWGQLGLGESDIETTAIPEQVSLPEGRSVSRLAANGHSLAVATDGTLWAWGWNFAGQLGTGTTDPSRAPQRVNFPEGVRIVEAAAGLRNSLALDADGKVWAWGSNDEAELGNSTVQSTRVPVPVAFPETVRITSIALGNRHSLALDDDGRVWSWGANAAGQRGIGVTYVDGHGEEEDGGEHHESGPSGPLVPTQVTLPGEQKARSIAAGKEFSFAIATSGALYAWGFNELGQLGVGGVENQFTPRVVPGISEVVAVSGGAEHALALTQGGRVFGWGSSLFGALGQQPGDSVLAPVELPGLANQGVQQVSAGRGFSYALLKNGSLLAWGQNREQQISAEAAQSITTPTLRAETITAVIATNQAARAAGAQPPLSVLRQSPDSVEVSIPAGPAGAVTLTVTQELFGVRQVAAVFTREAAPEPTSVPTVSPTSAPTATPMPSPSETGGNVTPEPLNPLDPQTTPSPTRPLVAAQPVQLARTGASSSAALGYAVLLLASAGLIACRRTRT